MLPLGVQQSVLKLATFFPRIILMMMVGHLEDGPLLLAGVAHGTQTLTRWQRTSSGIYYTVLRAAAVGVAYHRLDDAPTLALLSGLPVPRHSEGGFIPAMFKNARRELWPLHARDLLYQRYHFAKTLIEYERLDTDGRLRTLSDIEQDANARIAASGSTPLEQAVS